MSINAYLIVCRLVQASSSVETRVLCTIVCVHKTISSFETRLADALIASISVNTLPIVPARVSPGAFVDVKFTAGALVAKWASAGELVEVAIRRASAAVEARSN